ncbi:Flp family type IVb pilin [Altererythrobacter sp. CC-YST694]|nr:Flp family type IVb pilin [Altererythrobacter sp. CC-YST694]
MGNDDRQSELDGGNRAVKRNLFGAILEDTRGAAAVEYGLIVSLIVIAIVGALQGVGNGNSGLWALIVEKADFAMGQF